MVLWSDSGSVRGTTTSFWSLRQQSTSNSSFRLALLLLPTETEEEGREKPIVTVNSSDSTSTQGKLERGRPRGDLDVRATEPAASDKIHGGQSTNWMHYLRRHVKCDETKPVCQRCIKWRGRCDGYEERLDAQSRRSGSRSAKPPSSVESPSPPMIMAMAKPSTTEQPQCWYTAVAVETEKLLRRPSAFFASVTAASAASHESKVKEEVPVTVKVEEDEEEQQQPQPQPQWQRHDGDSIGIPCDDNFWRGIVPVLLRNNAPVWYSNLAVHALIDAKRASIAASASASIASASPSSTTTTATLPVLSSSIPNTDTTTTSPTADETSTTTATATATITPITATGPPSTAESYSRALRYHGMALAEVRNEVVGRGNLQIVTLCCLFFIIFQMLNGDEKAAQTHIFNGRNVMAELQRQSQGRPPANPDAVLHKELQKALRFLSMQVRGHNVLPPRSSLSPEAFTAVKMEK